MRVVVKPGTSMGLYVLHADHITHNDAEPCPRSKLPTNRCILYTQIWQVLNA